MESLTRENIKKTSSYKKPGVYRIYLFSKDTAIQVNRFLGTDYSGLIYIGSSEKTTLEYRLLNFLNSMDKQRLQNNHSAGRKIKNIESIFLFIANRELKFEVDFFEDSRYQEKVLLDEYRAKFGEFPPLNG